MLNRAEYRINIKSLYPFLIGIILSNSSYLLPISSKLILIFLLLIYSGITQTFKSKLSLVAIFLTLLGLTSIFNGVVTANVIDTSALIFLFLQLYCLSTQIAEPKRYFVGFIIGTLAFSIYSIFLFASDLSWIGAAYYVFRKVAGNGIDPNTLSAGVVCAIFLLNHVRFHKIFKTLVFVILFVSLLLYFSRGALLALLVTAIISNRHQLKKYIKYLLVALALYFIFLSDTLNIIAGYININSTLEGMSLSNFKRLVAWGKFFHEFSMPTIITGVSFSGLFNVGDLGYTYPHSTPIALLFSFGMIYLILHYTILFKIFYENFELRSLMLAFLICGLFVDLIFHNVFLLLLLMARKSLEYET